MLKDCGTEPSLARRNEASVLKAHQASVAQVAATHPQTWVACAAGDKQRRLYARAMGRPDVRRALARRATRGDEAKAVAAALRVLRLATNGDVRSCEAALDGSEDRFLQYPKRELAALLETSTKLEALRSIIKSSPKKRIVVLAAQPEALDLCEEALRDHALHVSKTPEDHDQVVQRFDSDTKAPKCLLSLRRRLVEAAPASGLHAIDALVSKADLGHHLRRRLVKILKKVPLRLARAPAAGLSGTIDDEEAQEGLFVKRGEAYRLVLVDSSRRRRSGSAITSRPITQCWRTSGVL